MADQQVQQAAFHPHELLIATIAQRLTHSQHVAVGALSPIPAAAALLTQQDNPHLRVSLLGSREHAAFTDGGRELFDCAAQGRIDTFFLSGVQIDGAANINLVGTGEYPALTRRFAGSFGSAYLYHLVPKVLLFCWNHSKKSLVEQVDFVSAAGPGGAEYRPGGPIGLVTNRCVFDYDPASAGFTLVSLHPGESQDSIAEHTSFQFGISPDVAATQAPNDQVLSRLRGEIAAQMQSTYPQFVEQLWGV